MCCLQEVKWIEQDSMMLGMEGMRYMLWCSGNGDGVSAVAAMVKEQLCVCEAAV